MVTLNYHIMVKKGWDKITWAEVWHKLGKVLLIFKSSFMTVTIAGHILGDMYLFSLFLHFLKEVLYIRSCIFLFVHFIL